MMDFEAHDGSEFEDANLIQPSGNATPPAVARSGATLVLTPNAQGVVILPDGVSLENIQIEGRNLVIIGADGTRYVIIDGAIVVPQLVVDGVAVPPVNLAALLLGNEPEPAAGNPQSSGGNFAGAVDDIQAAFDLGNLLPYTELQFPGDEEREIIPDVVDRDPGTVIVTPNNPAGAVMATASVNEAGLPARGSEPAGSNAASNSETTTGTIIYTAPDGLDEISINGVVITTPAQTVAGSFGILTVVSVAPGAIGYTYTLADNTLTPADDVFMVTVREVDGDTASAALNITIVDDTPTARNDTDSVAAATFTGETGNLLTGAGTTSGAAGSDTPGADGIAVTGIAAGTAGTFAAPGTINGQYGTLSINAQGNYTYTRSPGTPGGVTDVFTYRIADGDGDISTATLTIAIGDAPPAVTSVPTTGPGTVVDEEGLPVRGSEPSGSNEPAPVESTSGTITFVAPDGVGSVAINGTPIAGPGQQIATPQGTLTIDTFNPGAGTLTYTFTLGDNTSGDSTQVNLTVTVTDLDGDSDTEPFVITIIDDEPTARADADGVTEDGPTVADGNVITGSGGADANGTDGVADTSGADGANVTGVAFGATAGTVGTALAGAYGTLTLNADGSYSYALNNAHPLVQGLDGNDTLTEIFGYTLTDGDGDASSSTLTITINGANDFVVINGLDGQGAEETVYEGDLADGSSPEAAALTQGGTFTVDSQDGLAGLMINGTAVFGAGVVYPVTFSTAYGTMSITGVATTVVGGDVVAATVSYSYTLTDNTLLHTGANAGFLTESFAVVATDTDGSTDTASLDVTVVDDGPAAWADADSVTEDGPTVADGNVVTGSGGGDANGTDGVTDTQGADAATVTAVAFGATAGAVGTALAGAYGSLTLNSDGSYAYTLDSAHPLVQGLDGNDALTEVFSYTLTDGDGDASSTTLTISINGADDIVVINGLDGRGAEETVYENDLADGSSPDATALTQNGAFTIDSPDGLAGLTVNGTAVFGAGVVYPVTFSTAYGTMSITGVATTTDANGDVVGAAVSYSYTLTDNTLLHVGANDGSLTESFAVVATDTDGSTDTASLDVTIVDDVPTAVPDVDSVAEDGPTVADGNVIGGSGGTDLNATDGVTDTQGADTASVTAVAFLPLGGGSTAGVVGGPLAGAYGSLTLNADGSYSYALNNSHPLVQGLDSNDTLTETFSYTLTDGDGDASATTLTITINGADDIVVINGLDGQGAEETVYEDDLVDGSSPDAPALTQSGTFTVDSPDGLASLLLNGTPVFGPGVVYPVNFTSTHGTMSVTGVATTTDANGDVVSATVSYSYTLTDSLLHLGPNASAFTESFAVVATDTDGSTDLASLDVTIVDDVPTAVADADSVTEDGPTQADGNVITGSGGVDLNTTDGALDTQGADGAIVTAVAFGITPGVVGDPLAGAYGSLTLNADGSYTYTLNNAHPLVQGLDGNDALTEIFTYTLTDADLDQSGTTLTITINGADDIVVINGLDGRGAEEILYEDDLADGSSPDAAALTQPGTFTVDSPDGLATLTVNGTAVFGAGVVYPVTVPTAYGTMSITGVATTTDANGDVVAATVSYSYTLTDNTLLHTGANDGSLTESFAVAVTDSDGSSDTASLDVTIVDDVPTASDDTAAQTAENAAFTIDALANDEFGADNVDTANPAKVFVASQATYGTVTYDPGTGLFTYAPTSGAGSVTLSDSFTYTIIDRDGDVSTATVNVTLLPDSAPVALDVNAKIDDDGLPAGNAASNPLGSDEDQNGVSETGAGIGDEHIWTGSLAISSGGADTPLNYSFASAAGLGSVGTEVVMYSWDGPSNTLTATVAPPQTRAGLVLFTVKIDDVTTGAYTVTLVNPIAHATLDQLAGDDTENNTGTQVQLPYTVDDADSNPVGGDIDTGLLTIDFDDDTPSAADYSGATFDEGTGAHAIGDAATLLGIVGGADGVSGPLSGIVFTNQGATGGTLAINGAGQLIYTSPASVTSATTVTETFTYTVMDNDGDEVTKQITFGVSDTGVSNVSATNELVDEDDIVGAGGVAGGPGDDAPVASGHIDFALGADALQSITLSVVSTGLTKLDGVTPVSTSWNALTNTLTGYGTTPADVVFTITLTSITATGADYDVVLNQPVKHPVTDDPGTGAVETSFEDELGFTVGVSVKDADNSEGTTTFTVTIDDDSPVAGDYVGATFAEGTGPHTIGDAATLLGIAGGADGLSGPLSGIVFTNGGATGGTLAINGAGELNYTSPASVTSATTVTETFTYTITDKDGDAVTKTVTFGVSDTGVSRVSATNETVDEDDIIGAGGIASGPGDNAPVTSGHISYALGADALASITLSVAGTGLTKLDGVTPVSTSWNALTNTLTGYGTTPADVVFTITLSNITSTGADYDVVLFQPVKHPLTDDPLTGPVESAFEDNLSFSVGVTVEDADGSQGFTGFTVTIDDDSPAAADYAGATFAEGTGAHTIGDAATLLGIAGGADGLSGPLSGIVFTNGGATGGTLAINGAGELVYTSPTNATSATTVTETFTYTVTDQDGDAVTKQVTFGVSDSDVSNVSATNELVDEDDIVGAGGVASGPGDDAPVTSGHISFTLGQDALQSVTLSVVSTGLTKLDGVTPVSTSWDAGSNTLTGYGTNPADVVFTVTLTNITTTGADYNVVLNQPVKHPLTDNPGTGAVETSFEDELGFTVGVSVKDADNSEGTTTFTVTIDDDSPTATDDEGPIFAEGSGAHDLGDAVTLLGIAAGADGLQGPLSGIAFTNTTGTGGTLSINGAGRLIYTSPASVTSAVTINEEFSYTVTDKDGDAVTHVYALGVSDTGVSNVSATNETVDEDDIAGGSGIPSGPGDDAPVTSGHISFTLGADALQSITLSVASTGLTKLDGVTPVSTSWDAGSNTLTGYGTSLADVVFTVTLTNITATGADYDVVLVQPVKHPLTDDPGTGPVEQAFEDNLSFTVGVSIKDADNSTGTTSFTVTIDDDSPVAQPDSNGVAEGASVGGNVLTDGTADGFGADGAKVTAPVGGVVGVRAGNDTSTPASGSLGGPGIAGLYGTLILNADGSYTYQSTPNQIAANQQDVFVYTIEDKDGDLSTTTLTINLTAVNLAGVDADVTTYEKALDTAISGSDVAAGSVTGSQPSDTGETTTGNVTVAGATSYTISGGTIAANLTTVVGTYGTLVIDNTNGTFTYTLTSPFTTTPATDNGANTENNRDSFNYTASDGSGNTTTGTITVDIVDDVPNAVTTQNAVVGQVGGPGATSGTFDLDTAVTADDLDDNVGADGGTVRFNSAQTYPDLTSNGEAITYAVSLDGLTLTASTSAGTIFTVTLDPNAATPSYTVNMVRTVDVTAQIDFNAGGYNFTGGNKVWNGFVPIGEVLGTLAVDNNSSDLLLTPAINGLPDSTVNTTATIGGIGGAASVGATETFRVDFVTDLSGDPADTGGGDYDTLSKRDHVYDGHYTVNGATALFKSSAGSIVKITASKDSDDSDTITPGIQLEQVVGDGAVQQITKIQISYFGVSSALLTPLLDDPGLPGAADPQSVTVNGQVFTYRLLADGSVEVGGVAGAGGSSLDGTVIAVHTANGYNSIAYTHTGGADFQIGDFGASVTVPQPLSFALPIEVVDGDGDVAASYLDVNLAAWSLVSGVPTSVTQDQSAAVSGQVMVATVAQPHLIGSDFADTMTGTTGSNVLIGGRGADTMTGLAGSDLFVIDPSHITAANDDVIVDYAAGDTIDLRGLLSSMGSLAPTNAVEAAATVRLLGNILQVDSNGTSAGTTWVNVATLTNNPATISVLYQFDLPAISINSTPPLALDLDGDGVEFLSTAAGVTFDYGAGETATAWVDGDDGLLAIDLDGDGSVTSGAEIVFGSDGQTDLEGLAAKHDSNADGVLDAQDTDFARFGVWQDGNENGVSEAGEFRSLGELGITSIGLTSDGESYLAANGDVLVHGEASFVRDGSTFALADAAFSTAPIDRRTAEVAVATAAAGALVIPELAAASAPQPSAEQPAADTLRYGAVDGGSEQTGSNGDAAAAKRSDLLEDSAPIDAAVATASRLSDDASAGEDLPSAPDAGDDASAPGTGSEAGADLAASSGALFQFDGGEGLMEALLISASAEAGGLQPQDLAQVRETLADVADETAVDAIVSHFAEADVPAAPIGGEVAGSVLLDALDVQLVFAANGAQAPDALEDAAQLAAAAQA